MRVERDQVAEQFEGAHGTRLRPIGAIPRERGAPSTTRSRVAYVDKGIHSTRDVIGVGVCGAVPNVAHIAAGLAEGGGLGVTDQGLLLTRGLVEAMRIGIALGAERATFTGLAGVGDLIPRPV